MDVSDYITIPAVPGDLEKPLLDDTSSLRNLDSKSDALSTHSLSSSSSSLSAVPASLPLNSSSTTVSASPPMPKKGLTQILTTTGSSLFGRGKRPKSDGFGAATELAKPQKELSEKLPDARLPPKVDLRISDIQGVAKKDRKLLTNGGKVAAPGDLVTQPVPQKDNQLNRKSEPQVLFSSIYLVVIDL